MKTLNDFVEYLEQKLKPYATAEIDEKYLKKIVKDYSFSDTDWSEYIDIPVDKPYGRKMVHINDQFEIILMTWSLEKVCDIHDHGDSLGVVKVLKGEVINTIYTVDKDMNILNSEKIELAEEDVIIEVPEYMYHQMKNGQENEHSYTLHVYMPPINDMKVIDQEKQLIITVENNCGAWTTQPELHKEVEEFKFKKDVAKN